MTRSFSRLSRRALLLRVFPASGATLLYACGAPTPIAPSQPDRPKRGGTITGAQQNDWEGFDPHRQTSTPYAFALIYDTLVRLTAQPDGSIKPAPGLATEWELKDDLAVLKLRRGVQFHDGSVWNADVARFNLERLASPKSTARSFVASIASAEAPDPFTLRLRLKAPSGALLANLSQAADGRTFMISKAMAEKAGDGYGRSPETTAGTGPMKLIEWAPGSYHVAQRTGAYWENGVDGQPLPYFDTLRVRFVSNDAVRLAELRSGNVDIINNVAAKDVATARQDSGVDLVENPYQVSAYQFTFSTKQGPFVNNLKLRQAVQHAIDRDAVARVLGQGIGAPMSYFLIKGYLGYDESLPRYGFDPTKAKQLLADAGFPSGIDVRLSIINRAVDEQQAQVLKQMLGDIGIRLNIESLERLAWVNKMAGGQFEMSTYFTTMRPDPDSILGGRFETGDGKNYAGLSDRTLDDLLAKARSSYDEQTRAAAYRDVQRRVFETAWYGTIWFGKYFDAYRRSVKGRRSSQEPLWELHEAWLDR